MGSWKDERVKLTAERSKLNRDYVSLKAEVAEVETVKRSVDYIVREVRPQKEIQRHRWCGFEM